ncbi:MAG: DUF123 domain-containing protein [Candidatus Nanohaloarchaea archaeon]
MKGVYLLFLQLEDDTEVGVGALGELELPAGTYIYVGSAMNGVEKRLERHYGSDKKLHWHIDYLTEKAEVFDHFILPDNSEYECIMSQILSRFSEPVECFGSSDCDCSSHLYRMPEGF